MNAELESRLSAIPSNVEAAQPKKQSIPLPVALAFGVFDTVIGACAMGAKALRQLENEEGAAILEGIAEELRLRGKAMLTASARRIVEPG